MLEPRPIDYEVAKASHERSTRAPGWSGSVYPASTLYGPPVGNADHQSGKGTWPEPKVAPPPMKGKGKGKPPPTSQHGHHHFVPPWHWHKQQQQGLPPPEQRLPTYINLMKKMDEALRSFSSGQTTSFEAVEKVSGYMVGIQRLGAVNARAANDQLEAAGVSAGRRQQMVKEYRQLLNQFPRTLSGDYSDLMQSMDTALQSWMMGQLHMGEAIKTCSRALVEVQQMGVLDTAEHSTKCAQLGLDEPRRRAIMYNYLQLLQTAADRPPQS